MSEPPRSLALESATVNGACVVRVRGEVDLQTAPRLRESLVQLVRSLTGHLLVDLSQVEYMDSSGVGTMVFVKRVVERSGHQLVLVGLQPRVRSVLEITHLDAFFTIVDTIDQAAGR